MKTMYLREFAEERGVKPDTVAAYIREHEAEFEGHVWMEGKQKVLDEVALDLLDKKYPWPKPVQIIQDEAARAELKDTLRELAEARKVQGIIYEQLLDAKGEILQLSMQAAKVPLLEATAEGREARIQDLAAQLQSAQEATLDEQAARHAAELEAERLRAELASERSKTWWDKLRRR